MTDDVWTDWNPELAEAIAQRDSARNMAAAFELRLEEVRRMINERYIGPYTKEALLHLISAPLAVVETP